MSTYTGILGGALGAGVTYAWLKPKITSLEREIAERIQKINTLYNQIQNLRKIIASKENLIIQKDETIRQKDDLLAEKDAEISKLKEERKRALTN